MYGEFARFSRARNKISFFFVNSTRYNSAACHIVEHFDHNAVFRIARL